MKTNVTALGWFLLCTVLVGAALATPSQPPNIVFFLVDDLSYLDISHFGQERFSTPNIDRLAREGMVFSNAYCGAAWCAPSRTALLTGRDGRHFEPLERDADGVPSRFQPTVAEMLQAAGYATCALGKWHMWEGSYNHWNRR